MSNAAEISQIMATAKKMIEEKKAQLGLNAPKHGQPEADKKAAILALKAKIAAASSHLEQTFEQQLGAFQRPLTIAEQIAVAQHSAEERERSLNLIIDSEGRTVDKRTGAIVQIQSRVPTLKARFLELLLYINYIYYNYITMLTMFTLLLYLLCLHYTYYIYYDLL
jgi:hypothetical protein